MTRSLSTLRPTLKGEWLRTIFFCSFPCTKTSAGNTPEPEPERLSVLRAMRIQTTADCLRLRCGERPPDYLAASRACKTACCRDARNVNIKISTGSAKVAYSGTFQALRAAACEKHQITIRVRLANQAQAKANTPPQ